MTLGSILPYYGGKRSMAPHIVQELGPHHAYFEPFCGGLSVILAKPRSQQETVCDLNGDLINLAKVMADATDGPRLYRYARRLLAAEDTYIESQEWREALKGCEPAYAFARAVNYFAESWLGRNGLTGSKYLGNSFCVRYTPGGGSTATRWRHAVDSIPAFRRRLRDVTILCRDAFGVIDSIPDVAGVSIYCDPPYLAKSKPYIHDFESEDHRRLAHALRRFTKARVVVSYYDYPKLDELYAGWEKRLFIRHKNLSNASESPPSGSKCTEVLLTNGPSQSSEGAASEQFPLL